jgi:hypothetical protein
MTILREKIFWHRKRSPESEVKRLRERLTDEENANVLRALRVVRHRYGSAKGAR